MRDACGIMTAGILSKWMKGNVLGGHNNEGGNYRSGTYRRVDGDRS